MFRKFRRTASLILLLISIALIVWAVLPNKRQSVVQTISPVEMQISATGKGGDRLSMPDRLVELEWPDTMRIGDIETITLVFRPVVTDPVSSTQPAGYSDVYAHYNLMAEARYDVAGIVVTPSNPIRESMPARKPVKFTWKISADQVGSYTGSVWLSLRFLPLDGGQAIQVPIYIRDFNIQTSSLFGLNESMAFLLGGVGIVLAAVIVYDDLIGFVRKRKRKINTKDTMDIKVW
jgi:hypothetical protein